MKAEGQEQGKLGLARRAGRALAVLGLSWTAASILFTLVPAESAARQRAAPAFAGFRALTGLEQHWDMFVRLPHHRAYRVALEAEAPRAGGGGWQEAAGPVLPGLGEMPGHLRYHSFFTRLDQPANAEFLESYLRRTGEALVERRPELAGGRYRVRKTGARLQSLERVRDLGEASYEQATFHGPRAVPAVAGNEQP